MASGRQKIGNFVHELKVYKLYVWTVKCMHICNKKY